eukprot:362430-Chlamydomonas_euryale.AAC.1
MQLRGKYRQLRVLARSGYGAVVLCVNDENGTLVALKTFEGADQKPLVRRRARARGQREGLL